MAFSERVTFSQIISIGHSFETSGWIFIFTKTNIMWQILSRSDVSKKKVGYPTRKKKILQFLFMKNIDI